MEPNKRQFPTVKAETRVSPKARDANKPWASQDVRKLNVGGKNLELRPDPEAPSRTSITTAEERAAGAGDSSLQSKGKSLNMAETQKALAKGKHAWYPTKKRK